MVDTSHADFIVLFRRSENNVSRFFELFETKRKVSIRDIKEQTSLTDYSKVILHEIHDLNATVKEFYGREFIKPVFRAEKAKGSLFTYFEMVEAASLKHIEKFFIAKFKGKARINALDVILLVKRAENSFCTFLDLFEKTSFMPIRDIKLRTSGSSFYKVVIHEIEDVNAAIKAIDSSIEPFRPAIKRIGTRDDNYKGKRIRRGPVVQALERSENVTISHNEYHYIIRMRINSTY